MKHIYRLLMLFVGICVVCGAVSAQEAWMPDPNLRQAVRDQLELDADETRSSVGTSRNYGTLQIEFTAQPVIVGCERLSTCRWQSYGTSV